MKPGRFFPGIGEGSSRLDREEDCRFRPVSSRSVPGQRRRHSEVVPEFAGGRSSIAVFFQDFFLLLFQAVFHREDHQAFFAVQ